MLTWIELGPVWLSLRLAAVTTVILLIIGLPLAWWLVKGRSALCAPMNAVVTLPLVLPPSVLGFYILIALGPNGPIGQVTDAPERNRQGHPDAGTKVFAIPPPTISWSAILDRESRTVSLVETLEPPTIATIGRAGSFSALPSASSSSASRGPAHATSANLPIPWVDA